METDRPIRHILVAHDLEDTSEPALDFALGLARALVARVTVLYAYEIPTLGAPEVVFMATDWVKQFEGVARSRLEDVVRPVRVAGGIPIDTEVRLGSPWRIVGEFVRTHGVDLIVTGSHGRHGVPHAILGSVAERIVRTAPCPVLVVRGSAPQGKPA